MAYGPGNRRVAGTRRRIAPPRQFSGTGLGRSSRSGSEVRVPVSPNSPAARRDQVEPHSLSSTTGSTYATCSPRTSGLNQTLVAMVLQPLGVHIASRSAK